jgi:hypothetical protein
MFQEVNVQNKKQKVGWLALALVLHFVPSAQTPAESFRLTRLLVVPNYNLLLFLLQTSP